MKLARAVVCLVWVASAACDEDGAVVTSEKLDKPTTSVSTDPPQVETDAPDVPDTDTDAGDAGDAEAK